MTTKLIITSIAILTSMTVGIVALTQVYKSNTKVAMVSSSSSILTSRSLVASSSTVVQPSSAVARVELLTPKPITTIESVATNNESTPLKQLQVEVLDPNNPPQYITDYLTCQKTSPTKQFGTLIDTEDGKLEYKCPKSLEYYGCKTNLEYNGADLENKEGWICDPLPHGQSMSCEIVSIAMSELEKYKPVEFSKFVSKITNKYPTNNKCLLILNSNLSANEQNLIAEQLTLNYSFNPEFRLKIFTIKN